MAKLLILTLSTGEAALPVLTRQLTRQSFQDFEHEIIGGLANREAHNRLYATIMDRAAAFDLFLKIDADMTLRSDTSLADAVRAVDDWPDVGHFAFPIWDCFTEEETLGVHLFRSGVRWGEITDELFVDPDPADVEQRLWTGPPAPFVNHGEIVSDFECFSFGVHKFLKVAQRARTRDGRPYKAHKHARHMQNCARIRDLYRKTGARRHQLALAGMMWAMRDDGLVALSSKAALRNVFDLEVCGREQTWQRQVDRLSSSLVAWRLALLRSLGARRAFA
ncbi:MAG TPA: hypothetical protein VKE96_03310 [Vicinamibacterales bacterium]|nr:hypothetical protein [Vicinamibacterales bacterium]